MSNVTLYIQARRNVEAQGEEVPSVPKPMP